MGSDLVYVEIFVTNFSWVFLLLTGLSNTFLGTITWLILTFNARSRNSIFITAILFKTTDTDLFGFVQVLNIISTKEWLTFFCPAKPWESILASVRYQGVDYFWCCFWMIWVEFQQRQFLFNRLLLLKKCLLWKCTTNTISLNIYYCSMLIVTDLKLAIIVIHPTLIISLFSLLFFIFFKCFVLFEWIIYIIFWCRLCTWHRLSHTWCSPFSWSVAWRWKDQPMELCISSPLMWVTAWVITQWNMV